MGTDLVLDPFDASATIRVLPNFEFLLSEALTRERGLSLNESSYCPGYEWWC